MPKVMPAYQKIKEYIVDAINTGKWNFGDMIPAETALATQFQVSRMTVNRALKELSKEGIIVRRQGSGTYVNKAKFVYNFVEFCNVSENIIQKGKEHRANILTAHCVDYMDLPTNLKNRFTTEQEIYYLQILHFADNTPLLIEYLWINQSIMTKNQLDQQDFKNISLPDYICQRFPIAKGEYTLEAKKMPNDIAAKLHLQSDNTENDNEITIPPALVISRWLYTHTECSELITYCERWYNSDSHHLSGKF